MNTSLRYITLSVALLAPFTGRAASKDALAVPPVVAAAPAAAPVTPLVELGAAKSGSAEIVKAIDGAGQKIADAISATNAPSAPSASEVPTKGFLDKITKPKPQPKPAVVVPAAPAPAAAPAAAPASVAPVKPAAPAAPAPAPQTDTSGRSLWSSVKGAPAQAWTKVKGLTATCIAAVGGGVKAVGTKASDAVSAVGQSRVVQAPVNALASGYDAVALRSNALATRVVGDNKYAKAAVVASVSALVLYGAYKLIYKKYMAAEEDNDNAVGAPYIPVRHNAFRS